MTLNGNTLQHTHVFKVVRSDGLSSALLTVSDKRVKYGPVGGDTFVAPPADGTPIIAFLTADQALAFAKKHPGRTAYRAEVYGLIVPIERVLKIKHIGWERNLKDFWEAVRYNRDLGRFTTLKAPEGSVAVFGPMRLLEALRVPATPAARAPRW